MRVETDMSDSKPDLRVMRTRKAIKQSFEEMVSEGRCSSLIVVYGRPSRNGRA